MSKKTNTIWFLLGATIFNIIITLVAFFVFIALFSFVQHATGWTSQGFVIAGILLVFILSVATGFIVYRLVLKSLMKKIDVEKYFDPLFMPRARRL